MNQKVKERIERYALGAGAAGIPGVFLPGVDIGAVATLWISMITDLAAEENVELSGEAVAKFVTSVAGGAAAYIGGTKILTSIMSFTVVGWLPAAIINSALNYIYTKRLGKAVHSEFSKSHFDGYSFADMATGMLSMVFIMPGIGELWDAIKETR